MNGIMNRVQSPCIRNCCLNNEDVCLGCFRLLDEITSWMEADDAERSLILQKAKDRKVIHYAEVEKRRG